MASRDASGYSKEDLSLILGSEKVKQLAEESSESEVESDSEPEDVRNFHSIPRMKTYQFYSRRDLY